MGLRLAVGILELLVGGEVGLHVPILQQWKIFEMPAPGSGLPCFLR